MFSADHVGPFAGFRAFYGGLSEGPDTPPSWAGLLHVLAAFAATFDPPRKSASEVLDRDGWCCQAPACTGRRNLEQHHVTYRSAGGNDDLDNLITLCRFHHQRGEHDGLMTVRGRAPDDLTFRIGPAGRGSYFRDERRVAAATP